MKKSMTLIGLLVILAVSFISPSLMADHPDDQYWGAIDLRPPYIDMPVLPCGGDDVVEYYAMAVFNGDVIVSSYHHEWTWGFYSYSLYVWDGAAWIDLFQAVNCCGPVYAMTEYNGELILAGSFTEIGEVSANSIVSWDGTDLNPLGDGIDGTAYCVTVHNGHLYVAGDFTVAGSDSAHSIARWDGSTWHPLGQGIEGTVKELASFGGELIAGGNFDMAGGAPAASIASWNGATWSALGSGVAGSVLALAEYDGYLYAGGNFTSAGVIAVDYMARWNGSEWSAFSLVTTGSEISDLTVFDNKLILGGDFDTIQMSDYTVIEANSVATWDGIEFQPMDSGLGGGLTAEMFLVYEGHLATMYNPCFSPTYDYNNPGSPLGIWDDSLWRIFGTWKTSGVVNDVTEFDGKLVAAGDIWVQPFLESPLLNIGWYDGVDWHGFGSEAFNDDIQSLIVYNDELYVSGKFDSIGGQEIVGIAKWNGDSWEEVGGGLQWYTIPGGQNRVCDFCEYNGDLIIGGTFASAGGVRVNGIARWDGVSWHAMTDTAFDRSFYSLAVYDGSLIASGAFSQIDGVEVPRIARWDGVNWHRLEGSYTAEGSTHIRSLAVYNDELYFAGEFEFTILPDSIKCYGIARWDGSSISRVEPMLNGYLDDPADVEFDALETYHGELYVIGDFNADDDALDEEHIARYDGSYWRMLGSQSGSPKFENLSAIGEDLFIVCGNVWQSFPNEYLIYTWSKPVSCCVDYTGNIDGDLTDLVDIADLVYLVDFMFNNGAPPPCTAEADLDVTSTIDISDLVYLVDYMFNGGPSPALCP